MGPTIVAAHHRLRQGLEPVAPNPDLNHAGNFLYMLFNEVPDEETTRLLDVDFILHAEHGANASSFAARVTASTHFRTALSGGIRRGHPEGSGPRRRRRGSDEDVPEIGQPENAEEYCRARLESGGRIMGFGTAFIGRRIPGPATCGNGPGH